MHSLRETLVSIYGQLVPDDRNCDPEPEEFWKENLLIDAPPDQKEVSNMLYLYSFWLSPFDPATSRALSRLQDQLQKASEIVWHPVKSTKTLNPSAKPFSPGGLSISRPLKKFWDDPRWKEKIKTKKLMVMEGPHTGVVGTLTYWDKIGAWVKVEGKEASIFIFNKHMVNILKT